MLDHRHTPVGITPVATGASHCSAAAATVWNWAFFATPISVDSGLGRRF